MTPRSARRSTRCRHATCRSPPSWPRQRPRLPRSRCPASPRRPADSRRPDHVGPQRGPAGLSRPGRPVRPQAGPAGSRRPVLPVRRRVLALGLVHPGGDRPRAPELLRWLPGPPGTMTIQVQVADGMMITALEHPPPGLRIGDPHAQPKDGFLIWDVHEPDRPRLLGTWVSGGTGTHRNFYNGGPWVYATSNLPGFEGQVLAIVDIADPASPEP